MNAVRTFFEYLLKYQGAIKKFFVAVGAALAILVSVWADGTITGLEWLEVIIAFLGAFGVYGVKNEPTVR